jgi:nitronate monooxygenase
MRQSLEKAGYDLGRLQDKGDVNYGEKLKPISDEAKAWKTVWSAGQGVGGIDDLPSVAELVARLDAEYRAAQSRGLQLAQRWPR